MADQNDQRQLDDLLDSALSAYSAVEPRPGLEARIVARVQGSVEEPRTRWWNVRWLVAASAVAGITAIVLSVLLSRPVQRPVPVQARGSNRPVTQAQPDNSQQTVRIAPAPATRHQHHNRPESFLARRDRPSVFPSPSGLSEQERLMLAYVAQTPKAELIAQIRKPGPEEEEFWKDE